MKAGLMSVRDATTGPRHARSGRFAQALALPLFRRRFERRGLFVADSAIGQQQLSALRDRVARGETCYVVGLGISGHNSGVSLVEVSASKGIRLLSNDEEERFQGKKHCADYPEMAVDELARRLKTLGRTPRDVALWGTSWDYAQSASLAVRCFVEQLPFSWKLARSGSIPKWDFFTRGREARASRDRLSRQLGLSEFPPLVMFPHHENHAAFAYAASPFAQDSSKTIVTVLDGWGDRGAISHYLGENGTLRHLYSNDSLADSLGIFYSIISSTQGGWTTLSSEGRYMGAVAWGDTDRLTNPYYRRLRELLRFDADGRVLVNRRLANWQNAGEREPYTRALSETIGPPIPSHQMWNPDAVLKVEDIQHSEITRSRVDLAAATQLVFEDAIFNIVDHLIRTTGSDRLVMTGGTALNGLVNMRLLERYDEAWFERNLGRETRLRLWVPPAPGDAGVTIGAAYSAALRAGVRPGRPLQHAAYCGIAPSKEAISLALGGDSEIGFRSLGNVSNRKGREEVADLMAFIVSRDGVLGLFQGPAETGPRALGQRSILANPCNPGTLSQINRRVKFREPIRPLAPMVTPEEANLYFELSAGALDDEANAYRYMVLTALARPSAYDKIPAVIHRDGTCRIQIVREDCQPLVYSYLKAMGRRVGAEVSVNTSLNVGGPIAQSPAQALDAMKRAKALTGLVLIGAEGDAFLAWHAVRTNTKDGGEQLLAWLADYQGSPLTVD
jgi:carbamoyltransferase